MRFSRIFRALPGCPGVESQFFGALDDGEEFFAIEGSPCHLAQRTVDIHIRLTSACVRTNHNQPQPTTTNHNQPQPTTTDHNRQQPTTTNNNQQQPTTTNNNNNQQHTTQHTTHHNTPQTTSTHNNNRFLPELVSTLRSRAFCI